MTRTIHLEIECGAKTCAAVAGRLCRYVVVTRMGSCYHCKLFARMGEGKYGLEQLQDRNGWLQRHPKCLASEVKP